MKMLLFFGLLCMGCQAEKPYWIDAPAAIFFPRLKRTWHMDRREILEGDSEPEMKVEMLRAVNKAWGYGEFRGLKRDSEGKWVAE